ncbi:peptidylprolyl isomerase [Paenibacillus xerothermodurans]|uniref:Peptidyl-prolyl cis-trans isomerase n=1 Tax=Paenibacillus xerothermodurans TaxID=1977292 RepID=A0A2W1NFP0_PAEXE|nr:peptidylprolyl isomerase [Paenibacillus xerothermodurans]PZE21851.1 peptidylprolyl isomerase [Paenibacillus xerothermodurans]
MIAAIAVKTAKWAVVAAACVLLLSACGTKYAEQGAAASSGQGGTSGSAQGQSGVQGSTSAGDAAPSNPTANPGAQKSWTTPPEMQIDPNKSYQATVTTNKGTFTIDLFAKDAPKTVNNFVFLAKEGFYGDIIFHRIISTFMVQTGDPTGTGTGGPGYRFEDELSSPHKYEPGIVAMANAGPNTNGSQFFICTGKDSISLNKIPDYTIFGRVSEGMDVVRQIAATPVSLDDRPTEKVAIESVTITEE